MLRRFTTVHNRARSFLHGYGFPYPDDDISSPSGLAAAEAPEDVLVIIFHHLLPDHNRISDFTLENPFERWPNTFEAFLSYAPDYSDLLSVSLVCRGWYAASCIVLYARLSLSERQLPRFRRTLRKNAHLRPLVKQLCLPNQPIETNRLFLKAHRDAKDKKRLKDALLSVLHYSTRLDSLTLKHHDYHYTGVLSLDHTFSTSTSLDGRLRRLALIGNAIPRDETSYFIHANADFTHLEVLRLLKVIFTPGLSFPTLPNLHTLQMVQCNFWMRSGTDDDEKVHDRANPHLRGVCVVFRLLLGPQIRTD